MSSNELPPSPDLEPHAVTPHQNAPIAQHGEIGGVIEIRSRPSVRPWLCTLCSPTRTYSSQRMLLIHMQRHGVRNHPNPVYAGPRIMKPPKGNIKTGSEIPSNPCSVCLEFHPRTPFYECSMLNEIKAGWRELRPESCPLCLRLRTSHRPGIICWWVVNQIGDWRNVICRLHHQINHQICRECSSESPNKRTYTFEGVEFKTNEPGLSKEHRNQPTLIRSETSSDIFLDPELTYVTELDFPWDPTIGSPGPGIRPTLYNPIGDSGNGLSSVLRLSEEITLASHVRSDFPLREDEGMCELIDFMDLIHPLTGCCITPPEGLGGPVTKDPPSTMELTTTEDLPLWRDDDLSSFLNNFCPWDDNIFEEDFLSLV